MHIPILRWNVLKPHTNRNNFNLSQLPDVVVDRPSRDFIDDLGARPSSTHPFLPGSHEQ